MMQAQNHRDLAGLENLVAIIDDDAAVRSSLKFSLEVNGIIVCTYARAEELLADADIRKFQCLVIDQRLPGMSGIALIKRLRELSVQAPAILITSNPSKALRKLASELNTPIIEKPLLNDNLLSGIQHAIVHTASSDRKS